MTSFQLRDRLQTLLAATGPDKYLTKFLFIMAKGHEHMSGDLMEVLYSRNRTLFSKKQQNAQERFGDLRTQMETFPLGKVFHEVIALQDVLRDMEEAFQQSDSAFVGDTLLQVNRFYQALETFVSSRSDEFFVALIIEASHLYETVVSARKVIASVRDALHTDTEIPRERERLSLLFENADRFGAVVEKLGAIDRIYQEVAELAEVSLEEQPLDIVKLETGSLWVYVEGERRVIQIMAGIIERFALFYYRRVSVETGEVVLPERISATQSLLNLADELESAGFSKVAADEPRLRKSALLLLRGFVILLTGEPSLQINDQRVAVEQAVRDRFVANSRGEVQAL